MFTNLFIITDSDVIRLPEDATLVGFAPLEQDPTEKVYCNRNEDIEMAQTTLRIRKILFFGANFLCSFNPPILNKLTFPNHFKYISNVVSCLQEVNVPHVKRYKYKQ